jgi:hypothetical protein
MPGTTGAEESQPILQQTTMAVNGSRPSHEQPMTGVSPHPARNAPAPGPRREATMERTPEPTRWTVAEVQRRLGRVCLRRGNKREAARAWSKAVRAEPRDADLKRRLAELKRELAAMDAIPPARLVVVHESEETEEVPIRGPLLRIGAHPENDLVLRDRSAGPDEARILYREGCFWLEGSGEGGGFRLNGHPLHGTERLDDGAVIRIGSSTLRFHAGRV